MRRATIIILAAALAIAITGCGKKEEQAKKTLMVNAQSGLVMRQAPDPNSPKVTLIPYGEDVEVIEEQGAAVEIGGVSGKWTKVTWNGNTAWVFGGFLKEREINTPDSAIDRYYKMENTLYELIKKYKHTETDIDKYNRLVKNDLIENYKSIMTGPELTLWTNSIKEGSLNSGYFAQIYNGLSKTQIISKKEEKIKDDELKIVLTIKEEEPYNLEFGPDLKTVVEKYKVKNITQADFDKKTAGVDDTELRFTIRVNAEQTFTMQLIKGSWYIKKTDRKLIDSEIVFL
ncbi:MAG TPA: SH3 domain-containing protein [Spirochaetota bacterium]|nr:SH3 domain-containing protein [Spirochaetota bacterium]